MGLAPHSPSLLTKLFLLTSSSHCQVLCWVLFGYRNRADPGPPSETQSSEVNTVPKLCWASPSGVTGQILPGHQVAPSSRPGGGSRPPSPPGSAGSFAREPLAGATTDSPYLPSTGSQGKSLEEGRGSQTWELCPWGVGLYTISVFLPPPVAPCGPAHGSSLGGVDDKAERAGRGWGWGWEQQLPRGGGGAAGAAGNREG